MYRSYFRCFAGCPGEHGLTEAIYRCPTCEGLLMVEHDLSALRQRSALEWRGLFDARYRSHAFPFSSGVWGKREWVAPSVLDAHIVSMGEGATPLVHARLYGQELGLSQLWIKQCGQTHTGSFKDLGMTVLVSTVVKAIAEHREGKRNTPFPKVLAC